jgi:hypothetical protein
VKILLANLEPSTHGPSRHVAPRSLTVTFGAKRTLVGRPPQRIYEFAPFCNGPDEVQSPSDCHAAEPTLLSVVRRRHTVSSRMASNPARFRPACSYCDNGPASSPICFHRNAKHAKEITQSLGCSPPPDAWGRLKS